MPPAGVDFLGRCDLFEGQPAEVLGAVFGQGTELELGAGAVLFRQGDRGDRLFIVKNGVLEVLASRGGAEATPVAYVGPGEVLGELALLTGSPRSATVRAPERAELFVLEKAVFLDLMDSLPSFSRNLCALLAKRLETTTQKVPRAPAKQLQGNLRFFDLATVIQTLIGSHQTGSLIVSEETGGQKIAELFFYKGNVARGRLRHLSGDDAVYQLFQGPLEGDFSFAGRAVEETEVQADVTLPAINLLMEAVRMQDELPLLKQRLPDPGRPYRQASPQLAWSDADSVDLAAAVWARLKKGASLQDLEREIPRCSYAIYKTMAELLETGQAR